MSSPLDSLTRMLGLPAGWLDGLYPFSLYQQFPPLMDRTPPALPSGMFPESLAPSPLGASPFSPSPPSPFGNMPGGMPPPGGMLPGRPQPPRPRLPPQLLQALLSGRRPF